MEIMTVTTATTPTPIGASDTTTDPSVMANEGSNTSTCINIEQDQSKSLEEQFGFPLSEVYKMAVRFYRG